MTEEGGLLLLAGLQLPNLHLLQALRLQQLEINDENSILMKTKDAVITLQNVLEGKHDEAIENNLNQYQVSRDRWWSALYKVVEGLAVMSRLSRSRLQQSDFSFDDRILHWDDAEM